jgi:predicted metal-dependent phosphoesterase TrpH
MIVPTPKRTFAVQNNTKIRKEFADLHMHSRFSDGALTVSELIDLAATRRISCISITDHDNFDAYESGKDLAEERGLELIPGIEISAVHKGRDIHILGYFIDVNNLALNLEMREQAKNRINRVKQILKKLQKMGMPLSMDKVLSKAGGGVIGRPHIAQAMLEEEYVNNFHEAFSKYLSEEGEAYVEKKGLSVEEAIQLIRRSGGISVLAHPYKSRCDDLIPTLVECGLGGIETYVSNQKGNVGRHYRDLAKHHNLICSGGSDFHYEHSTPILGSLKMPYNVVDQLRDRLEKQKTDWF